MHAPPSGWRMARGQAMHAPWLAPVQITIKSSSHQILPAVRKILVEKMAPLLVEAFGVQPTHTTTVSPFITTDLLRVGDICHILNGDMPHALQMFEELSVENIAVGTNIMVYRASLDKH